MTYRRIRGAEESDVTDAEAIAAWDRTHHDYRTGQLGGSFIIFERDGRGYKTNPTLYKPYKPSQGDTSCASDPGT